MKEDNMFEKVLQLCKGMEVELDQKGRPWFFTGTLKYHKPPLDDLGWSVRDRNMVLGFSTEDVLDVRLSDRKTNIYCLPTVKIFIQEPK